MVLDTSVTHGATIAGYTGLEDKFNEVHNNKYKYHKSIYINARTKIIITCPEHGDFEQLPYVHVKGSGCKKCGSILTANSKKHTKDKFVEIANKVHNNRYDYSKFEYTFSKNKSIIICKVHGEFNMCANVHKRGAGCPYCAWEENAGKQRLGIAEFIEKANIVHDNFYDYSLAEYINIDTPIKIICPNHGLFETTPYVHLRSKCSHCARCGFDVNKKGILYVATVSIGENMIVYKLGITGRTFDKRYSSKERSKMQLIRTVAFDNGKECFNTELQLKKLLKPYKYKTTKKILARGDSELFTISPIPYLDRLLLGAK